MLRVKSMPLVAVLLSISVLLLADGLWLKAKALLAQQLIERAWQQTLQQGEGVKPWPWADTWPVARLQAAGEDVHVLYGVGGNALAFAPGMLPTALLPEASGSRVIAGHRDTHFRFTGDLQVGDELQLTLTSGRSITYRVVSTTVVDSAEELLAVDHQQQELILISCYPFDAINPGGPLRWVVRARAV